MLVPPANLPVTSIGAAGALTESPEYGLAVPCRAERSGDDHDPARGKHEVRRTEKRAQVDFDPEQRVPQQIADAANCEDGNPDERYLVSARYGLGPRQAAAMRPRDRHGEDCCHHEESRIEHRVPGREEGIEQRPDVVVPQPSSITPPISQRDAASIAQSKRVLRPTVSGAARTAVVALTQASIVLWSSEPRVVRDPDHSDTRRVRWLFLFWGLDSCSHP